MPKKRYRSTEERERSVCEILDRLYEPERQDRCKLWVYRNYICKQFGISERTFFRYIKKKRPDNPPEDDRQLKLF
jgi:hypothetical protein